MGNTTRLQDIRERLEESAKNLINAKTHADCIAALDQYEEALTAINAEDMLLLIGKLNQQRPTGRTEAIMSDRGFWFLIVVGACLVFWASVITTAALI